MTFSDLRVRFFSAAVTASGAIVGAAVTLGAGYLLAWILRIV